MLPSHASLCLATALVSMAAGPAPRAALPSHTDRQIEDVRRAHMPELRRCFDRERATLPSRAGRMGVRMDIWSNGEVRGAAILHDSLGAPGLRDCFVATILRWRYPALPGSGPRIWRTALVSYSFVFDDKGMRVEDWPARTWIQPTAGPAGLRVFMMRFGGQLLPLACAAGQRSFIARECIDAIQSHPTIGLEPRYADDTAKPEVSPSTLHFLHDDYWPAGFALPGWSPVKPDPDDPGSDDAGALDGYAVWPPGAFTVTLSPLEQKNIDAVVRSRCRKLPAHCRPEDRPPGDDVADEASDPPPAEWTGPLATQARRMVGHVLRRAQGRPPLVLEQTFELDLDGDGDAEKIHNVALRDTYAREDRRGRIHGRHIPYVHYFLFVEQQGRLTRLPVHTRVSQLDGVDGLVLGWFDLDADGRPELWLQTPRWEGSAWQVVRLVGRELRGVAELGFDEFGETEDDEDGSP